MKWNKIFEDSFQYRTICLVISLKKNILMGTHFMEIHSTFIIKAMIKPSLQYL